MRTLFLTAAQTGLRQGELRALRWEHVNWPASSVLVYRNVERTFDLARVPNAEAPSTGYRRTADGTPKTEGSERRVPLPDEVAGALDRLYRAHGEPPVDRLVFPSSRDGGPLGESTIARQLAAALKAAKLPHHTFHDFRHTFGTSMAAAGVPMRTLQAWMGHEDMRTTQIYAHYSPAHDEAATVTAAFAALRAGSEVVPSRPSIARQSEQIKAN
jgi:integrase